SVVDEAGRPTRVIAADRRAIVAEAMQFTAEEAGAFWPLYHQYRTGMDTVGDGIRHLVLEYAGLYPDVPDDRAKAMLKELAALEKKHAATRAEYLKKFARVLPAAKALRFAQVENRLDLALRLELAASIPLVPIEGEIAGRLTEEAAYIEGAAGGVVVKTLEITARVAALDPATRKVTLLSPSGIRQTVKVGPEAINFDQIRVGDRLRVLVTEELMVDLAGPGESAADGAEALVALAPKGAKPGGLLAETAQTTATVTAIDQGRRTATLKFADESIRTFPVRADVDLGRHKVGEQVVFRVTEMVAISVDKP
ncbi:MAG TPA: hypothetical protein PKE47_09860, partial [Verrucomicrobiota bacterium]|nr:hypothetical protein [Verrucomicrobiota bacterium]